jgi:hypothetical protein
VNEHEVEIGVNAIDDLTTAFRVLGRDHDIPQGTKHERPRTARPDGIDQRVELEAKRSAAEGERLDQNGIWPRNLEGSQQRRSSGLSQCVVNRSARDVDKVFEPRVAGSDRGELNDAFGRRTSLHRQRLSSRDEGHSNTLPSEPVDDSQSPPQMPDAEQLLNVE